MDDIKCKCLKTATHVCLFHTIYLCDFHKEKHKCKTKKLSNTMKTIRVKKKEVYSKLKLLTKESKAASSVLHKTNKDTVNALKGIKNNIMKNLDKTISFYFGKIDKLIDKELTKKTKDIKNIIEKMEEDDDVGEGEDDDDDDDDGGEDDGEGLNDNDGEITANAMAIAGSNIISDLLNLEIQLTEDALITVQLNPIGTGLGMQNTYQMEAGVHHMQLDVTTMNTGVHLVRVSDGMNVQVMKVLIVR